MQELQLLAGRFDWQLCSNRCSSGSRNNLWHAGIHVLGSRVSIHAQCLHRATKHLSRRSRSWIVDLQYSHSHAAASAAMTVSLIPHPCAKSEKGWGTRSTLNAESAPGS